jgi:hypothetical protein
MIARLATRGESLQTKCGTGFQPVKKQVENLCHIFHHGLLGQLWRVGLAWSAFISSVPAQEPQRTPHERPPTHPWVRPVRPLASASSHACRSHIVRDGYTSLQVNVSSRGCNIVGDAANEPSIAVSLDDPRKLVIGWRQFNSVGSSFREPGWGYSHDAGRTWVFRGSVDPGVFGSDPVLAAGVDGEIHYLSINFEQTRLFRSSDGGISWPQHTQVSGDLLDKPWLAVDTTNSPWRGNIYVSSDGRLFEKTSLGSAFELTEAAHPLWPSMSVGADGTLYAGGEYPNFARCTQSAQGTFSCEYILRFTPAFVILDGKPDRPNGQLHGMVWVATDRAPQNECGNVFLLGNVFHSLDDPADLMFRASMDEGRTWTDAVRVHDDPTNSGAWQWFGMMSVAPNGRIDAVWNDTRNYLVAPNANLSELYYAYSANGGVTWSKNIPVSPVFDSHIGYPMDSPKLGDYYHMLSDNLGVNVAYAATFNGEQDIYFLRIGPWDCNSNEIDDAQDISEATSIDCNDNDVPDECEYRVDVDGDGLTTLEDFATFRLGLTGPHPFAAHRAVPHGPKNSGRDEVDPPSSPLVKGGGGDCAELLDADHDGDVDLGDFYLLSHVFVGPQ